MPDQPDQPLARATAGQIRRAGFVVPDVDDDATTGFEVLTHHLDDRSRAEHAEAVKRGDDRPKAKP